MSIDYRISEDGLRIEAFPKGVLSVRETIDYFDKIKNENKIKENAIEIVYFKYVSDFRISYTESEKITKNYQKPKALRKIKATIFVCETKLAYGIGRMLQTFHEITNPEHKVLISQTENELENLIKAV